VGWRNGLAEVASLYKGVISAATGAGIIIGAYFAFYSTSKRYLKQHTDMSDGELQGYKVAGLQGMSYYQAGGQPST
jgi:solute carrier family 25 S-adenosylmethionine transporter 26